MAHSFIWEIATKPSSLSRFYQNSYACSFSLNKNMTLKIHIMTHFAIQSFSCRHFKFFKIARRPLWIWCIGLEKTPYYLRIFIYSIQVTKMLRYISHYIAAYPAVDLAGALTTKGLWLWAFGGMKSLKTNTISLVIRLAKYFISCAYKYTTKTSLMSLIISPNTRTVYWWGDLFWLTALAFGSLNASEICKTKGTKRHKPVRNEWDTWLHPLNLITNVTRHGWQPNFLNLNVHALSELLHP